MAAQIPVPGVSATAIQSYFASKSGTIFDLINTFTDSVESKLNDIASLLDGVTIDSMENIKEACEIARSEGKDLY